MNKDKWLYFTLMAIFFLAIPNIFLHHREWFIIFIFYPYFLLPIISLFWIWFWYTKYILVKLFNLIMFCFLSYFAFIFISEWWEFSLACCW